MSRGHGDLDPAHADPDLGADLQQLQAQGTAGGDGEAGVGEADAAQRAQQRIGHGGEVQAKLVGAHGVGRGAIGEQVELAFLDGVLHLAALAIELLVEISGPDPGIPQRGEDEARIGFAVGPFGLGDDPALAAPALARTPHEVLEAALWLAAARAGPRQLGLDLRDQPGVLGQAEQIIDPVGLAPRHQGFAGKPRIGAQQNPQTGPAAAQLRHDPRHLLDRPGCAVDVRRPQLRGQEMTTAENVERQIAVTVVVALVALVALSLKCCAQHLSVYVAVVGMLR